jgi:hypothetical protein
MFSTPEFLVVGPFKTGTSWIYEQLKTTEGFDLPPIKELYFFYDADLNYQLSKSNDEKFLRNEFPSRQLTPSIINTRKLNLENKIRESRKYRFQNLVNAIKAGSPLWGLFYYFFPKNLSEKSFSLYTKLFKKTTGHVSGDISPIYFVLSPYAIEKIKEYFPDIKIIFIMREPVEREWSNIRMKYFTKGEEIPFSADEYFASQRTTGDYINAITNWEKYFSADQILYLFYDELVANPTAFTGKLLDFLKPGAKITLLVKEKVMQGVNKSIDQDLKIKLIEKNLPQYHFLAEKFSNSPYPSLWLKAALDVLNKQ